ncbi:CLIP domain-containing serine protease B15-like isoform X2 [Cylas formicarius]|uniref:CLIP domain-containing serine protease B15-like isoform X2 n=1 Tax=Cylas formicarius TaxID=197179 RepID=UPI0029585523|nr:CLIP domain-containing serine protease B15-like isoform X2 [Cylas formicarius]
MFIQFVIPLVVVVKVVSSQGSSPCPETFIYEPRNSKELDRWYGVVSLRTDDDLEGVYLKIQLDRPADLLGNWFGDVISQDNVQFSINNAKYKLEAGPPVSVRFFVKYNAASIVPTVKKILLNGRSICSTTVSPDRRTPIPPTLHISKPATSPGNFSNMNKKPGKGNGNTIDHNGNTRLPGQTNIRDELERPTFHEVQKPNRGTNIDSGHSQRPTNNVLNIEFHSDEDGEDDFFSGDLTNVVNRPALNRPNILQTPKRPGCGIVNQRANALVSHGQNTSPGQWPWHAALYHSKGIQLLYTCGGTLISDRYIVTAAHCVTKPQTNQPVNKKYLLVYLGKHNLLTFGPEVQDRAIENIHVHPRYNYSVYFNDIALLELVTAVELTDFVRPCCLWEGNSDLEILADRLGSVIGWGFDENRQLSRQLMQAQMPVVSTVKCIYSNREFFSQFTFENNYCAGFRNGTSVCNGDSGGGMVFPRTGTSGADTVWQLRGIVSVGVALQSQGVCDTSHYIIFTDVAKYLPWIRELMTVTN